MPDLDQIPKTYEDACLTLAKSHAEENAFPITVECFPDPRKQEVRLVEIGDSFPSNTYAATMFPDNQGRPERAKLVVPVVVLRSSADFPFRSSVALVTDDEWKRILAGELEIAGNWNLTKHYQIWPK